MQVFTEIAQVMNCEQMWNRVFLTTKKKAARVRYHKYGIVLKD